MFQLRTRRSAPFNAAEPTPWCRIHPQRRELAVAKLVPQTILVELASASAILATVPSTAAGIPKMARKSGRITVVVMAEIAESAGQSRSGYRAVQPIFRLGSPRAVRGHARSSSVSPSPWGQGMDRQDSAWSLPSPTQGCTCRPFANISRVMLSESSHEVCPHGSARAIRRWCGPRLTSRAA